MPATKQAPRVELAETKVTLSGKTWVITALVAVRGPLLPTVMV